MKVTLGAKPYFYAMPTVLVGANVDGKPNFMTAVNCGLVQLDPPMVAVSINIRRHTYKGMKANEGFSINIPESCQAQVTDYYGLVSGAEVDKSVPLGSFYGKLQNVPMLKTCPVNLECKLFKRVELGGAFELFIGQIVETYVKDSVLTDGKPDMRKIDPIVYSTTDHLYFKVGDVLGKAFEMGKVLKK